MNRISMKNPTLNRLPTIYLRWLLGLVIFASAMTASARNTDKDEVAIRAALTSQADAWNRGDLDAFMDGYERSSTLRFASGDSITYGWQQTLDRYRARYPDRAAMGTLSFNDIDIEVLSKHSAIAFGHWALKRGSDAPRGLFTLLLHKTDTGWKITRDHTSAAGN